MSLSIARSMRAGRRAAPAAFIILAACLAVVGATRRAGAASRSHPVKGHAVFQLAPGPGCGSPFGICTSGTIAGDIRGTIQGVARAFSPGVDPSVPSVASYVNGIVIRTAEGDLMCTEAGAANTAGDGEFSGLCEITGGTGRLAGASGYLHFFGVFNPVSGGSYDYVGKVTLP